MIQIISETKESHNGRDYHFFELSSGKQSVAVSVVEGKFSYVNVMVQNAAHKAWRGYGKDFSSIDAAIANYKNADIKAMLEYVRESR